MKGNNSYWSPFEAGAWSSRTFSSVNVVNSTISESPFSAVLVDGEGTVGGETCLRTAFYASPGVVFRPRSPETVNGADGQSYSLSTEALAARLGDNLVPLAWRDLRWNKAFPSPRPGTIAYCGYGGGFLCFDDAINGASSLATLYVPYGGKCLSIVLDPEKESIKIVHGDGMAIILEKGNILFRAAGGAAYQQISANGHVLNGNTKVMGGLDVGGGASEPVALAPATLALFTAISGVVAALATIIDGKTDAGTPQTGAATTAATAFAGTVTATSLTVPATLMKGV